VNGYQPSTALAIHPVSTGSVRTVELATASLFVCLALMLRWAPSRSFGPRDRWRRAAWAPSRWASGVRRPTARQAGTAILAGCAAGAFIGGSAAVPVGLLVGLGALVLGARRVSDRELRARQRLIAAAPPAADLFAAGLAAGLLPADAALVVATAFGREQGAEGGSPDAEIAERFGKAARALHAGTEPDVAWRFLSVDVATAAVGAAALRCCRTGAPAAVTVAKAARDTWGAAEQAAQAQIRSVAVRATAPLALCFLPAFILVGVVPTAIGLLTELKP
jgi:hypothetical protein